MILSRTDLRRLLDGGSLAFSPSLEDQQIGASAIDLRLGYNFAVYPAAPAGLAGNVSAIISQTVDLGDETLVVEFIRQLRQDNNRTLRYGEYIEVQPPAFLLAETLETFTLPADLAARVEGRSIYARLGLTVHQTAPSVKPGWAGQLTLEIVNNGPYTYRLYPGMRLCQLILERMTSPADAPGPGTWENLRF